MSAAKEITVLCPGAVKAVVIELAGDFSRETGTAVKFVFGTGGALQAKAAAGETADVVMVPSKGMEDLVQKGIVLTGSSADIGGVGIGMAVKAGTPLPDVSSPEALGETILAVRSLCYADPVQGAQSGIHFAEVLEGLGLAEEVRDKVRLFPGGPMALQKVASGEIELGVAQVSEIAGTAGVTLAGPLPPPLQKTLTFSAGLLAKSSLPELAKKFIDHLITPAAKSKFRNGGFELAD